MKNKDWTCSSCTWWWDRSSRCSKCEPDEVSKGECHRFPPTVSVGGFGIWPSTGSYDGCGEWKSENEDGR